MEHSEYQANEQLAATHVRTGFRCMVLVHGSERCFCNFGERANPFTWVRTDELEFVKGARCS
jgi:hypothetical protein